MEQPACLRGIQQFRGSPRSCVGEVLPVPTSVIGSTDPSAVQRLRGVGWRADAIRAAAPRRRLCLRWSGLAGAGRAGRRRRRPVPTRARGAGAGGVAGRRRARRGGGGGSAVRPLVLAQHHGGAGRVVAGQPAPLRRTRRSPRRSERQRPVRRALRAGARRGGRGLGRPDPRRLLRPRGAARVPGRRLLRDRQAVDLRLDARHRLLDGPGAGGLRSDARAKFARIQAVGAPPRGRPRDRAGHRLGRQLPHLDRPGRLGARGGAPAPFPRRPRAGSLRRRRARGDRQHRRAGPRGRLRSGGRALPGRDLLPRLARAELPGLDGARHRRDRRVVRAVDQRAPPSRARDRRRARR